MYTWCICGHVYSSVLVEFRSQFCRVSSLIPPLYRFLGLNSGHQVCVEPSLLWNLLSGPSTFLLKQGWTWRSLFLLNWPSSKTQNLLSLFPLLPAHTALRSRAHADTHSQLLLGCVGSELWSQAYEVNYFTTELSPKALQTSKETIAKS